MNNKNNKIWSKEFTNKVNYFEHLKIINNDTQYLQKPKQKNIKNVNFESQNIIHLDQSKVINSSNIKQSPELITTSTSTKNDNTNTHNILDKLINNSINNSSKSNNNFHINQINQINRINKSDEPLNREIEESKIIIGGKRKKSIPNNENLKKVLNELTCTPNKNLESIHESDIIYLKPLNARIPIPKRIDRPTPKQIEEMHPKKLQRHPPISSQQLMQRRFFNCFQCKMIFHNLDSYNEHNRKHVNENENNVCFCEECGILFNNDDEYNFHKKKCKNNKILKTNSIPIDPNGKYNCPVCNNKYSNAFILGEHFITSHNDYSVLCTLDERVHNGFPGFDILYKIKMINKINKKVSINVTKKKCKICFMNFTYNNDEITKSKKFDDIIMDNKNPLTLTCCKFLICHDCLMNHVSINDTLICPFCRKDHTRIDLTYITYIDIIHETDRTKWIPWWENHLDIFISHYNIC